MRTCVDCGAKMISHDTWYGRPGRNRAPMSVAERAAARADGHAPAHTRDRCVRCASAKRHGTPTGERRPVADVTEDWAELVDNRLSQAANVRNLAPRLGMTEGALERAVLRAKRRGLLEVAA